MEDYKKRLKLIKEIENETDSNFIGLIYNTTPTRFRTQLAGDVLSPFYALIKSIPKNEKRDRVSLVLHSSGGSLDVITSFVYIIRKKFKEFHVVVPESAHSAATILSFGADKILMSHYSSLSPFDPQLALKTQAGIIGAGTEDIRGYYSLINEFFKDDMAKIQAFNILANRFPPEVLGNIERIQKQVGMVVTKLLEYHNLSPQRIKTLIGKFQKEFFSHQYRIHFDEAKKLGLDVYLMNDKLENTCLNLLSIYKNSFGGQVEFEVEIPEEQNSIEIVLNRSYLESQYSSFSYKTKYRVFKDKRVEVEELGWLDNEFLKKKKGEEK